MRTRRTDRDPAELLPLPALHLEILLALSDGERHGYAIRREIKERTNGQLDPGAGSLYGAINKLLAETLIAETEERPDRHLDDERRRYYRLTDWGRQVANAEIARLSELVRTARTRAGLRTGQA